MELFAHGVLWAAAVFLLVLGCTNLNRTLQIEREPHASDSVLDSAGLHIIVNAVFVGLGVGLVAIATGMPP